MGRFLTRTAVVVLVTGALLGIGVTVRGETGPQAAAFHAVSSASVGSELSTENSGATTEGETRVLPFPVPAVAQAGAILLLVLGGTTAARRRRKRLRVW
jgi:hypothetical protein